MRKLMTTIAFLGLISITSASAETIAAFSFSGMLYENGRPQSNMATVSAQLTFDQTGSNVVTTSLSLAVIGVPGFDNPCCFSSIYSDSWNIAPSGDLLDGVLEYSVSSEIESFDFGLSYNEGLFGSFGFFGFYPSSGPNESLGSSTVTFTQISPSPVTEPKSVAIFVAGLAGLALLRVRSKTLSDLR